MNAFTAEELLRMVPPDTAAEQASALLDENSPDVEPLDGTPRPRVIDQIADAVPYQGGAQPHALMAVGGVRGEQAGLPLAAAPQRQAPTQNNAPTDSGGGRSFDFARGLMGFGGGAAGIAAYDKAERDRQEAPLRQMAMEDQVADRQTKRKELVDAMNPGSESSKAAQQSFAEMMRARAAMLAGKNDRLAKMFADAAGTAAGKSKLQLASMEKNYTQTMGEFGKMLDAEARRALAERGLDLRESGVEAQQENANATRALRRDTLAETGRHNRAMEGAATQKLDAKIQGNQDKLNEKIEGLNNAEGLLQQAAEAKKNVDVGPIATRINKLRQYTPWPDKNFDQLQQTLGSVRNEIKLLKAGKAVTANEEKGLNEELANLEQMQNDPTFEAKLRGMMERISGYKRQAVNQYQRKAGGETVDRSNTARTSTQSAKSLTPGEQAQVERARKAAAEGNAKAAQWLKENGHAP
jgi:hypothetical protein